MQAEKTVWAAGSNCLPDDVVFAFVHGELGAQAEQGIEEHLHQCADCRSVVAETARFVFQPPAHELGSSEPPFGDAAGARKLGYKLLEPGTHVSRYVLGGLIGVGAASVVYGAQDPQLRRGIALKVLRPDQSQGPRVEELKARLLREARAMAQLSHPNVVTVYDVGTYEDQIFIVMELVEGGTLDRWLVEQKRPWREIVRAFSEAGRGLAAAHAVQIVHRDFKPANVLVGSDGRVRVTDFGLAHPMVIPKDVDTETVAHGRPIQLPPNPSAAFVTWTATEAGGMAGTPVFMAPEQFLRKQPVPRTDQFSFCVALYMALYGHHPFSKEGVAKRTLSQLAEDVVAGHLYPPPAGTDVPLRLFEILSRGLAVDPDGRFASMQELLAELTNDGADSSAPQRFRRRSAWVVASLGVAAIATWAAARAPKPKSVAGQDHVAVVDGADAAAPPIPTPLSGLLEADRGGTSSAESGSTSVERAPPQPAPARPSTRVNRKVGSSPPKAARNRYDDGLKDPF